MNSLFAQQNNTSSKVSTVGGLNSSAKNNGSLSSGWQTGSNSVELDSQTSVRKQMQQQLRELFDKQQNKNNLLTPMDKQEDIFGTQKEEDKKEDKLLESGNTYNFKEVSNKIMRAKTSVSAGQAVVAAKRKISEIKRKLASSEGDSDDLQLALTHARKMEVVAQRKKNNLEMEEMAKNTRRRDEMQEKLQDSASSLKNDVVEAAKDQIMDEQLKNIQEQSEISREEARQNREEIQEKLKETEELTEQMMENMDEMEDFSEEMSDAEMEALKEMSEMLDAMETIDPHMSEEELSKLKLKHRLSENKALMKADMDYLKGMFKSMDARGANGMTTLGQGMSFGTVSASPSIPNVSIDMNTTAMEAGGGSPSLSVDVSV